MNLANPMPAAEVPVASANLLTRADELIDWALLDDEVAAACAQGGRQLTTAIIKLVLLMRWYNVAESGAAVMLDRLSFRAFIGYAGDAGAADAQIEAELADGYWARHPDMVRIIESVDDQLRLQGYSVRAGRLDEPSLMPCTASGSDSSDTEQTQLFKPGEVGRLVEAVAEKAHLHRTRASTDSLAPQESADMLASPAAPIDLENVTRTTNVDKSPGMPSLAQGERARAILDWPWGQRAALTGHLNIGRDHDFSPFARDLTPYTHVSRRHAELMVYGDGVWVRDLGSRNGTYVNNDEVPKGQAYLIDSDCILRFGPLLAVALKIVD